MLVIKYYFFETGEFSVRWYDQAKKLNIDAEIVPGDWRHGVDPKIVAQKLSEDKDKKLKQFVFFIMKLQLVS